MKKWFLTPVFLVFISACSDTKLSKPPVQGQNVVSEGAFCTQPPDLSNKYTKFMFIIDKSGSNVVGNGTNGTATDPNNKKRANNIEAFWNDKKNNPFIKWSFVAFQGSAATPYIGTSTKPLFSSNAKDMEKAIGLLRSNPDDNATPYKAALNMAQIAITQDLKDHPEEDSTYMLFFMSDGYPTDYNTSGNAEPAGTLAFEQVDQLINTAPGKIFLSTAYYGPVDPPASEGLKTMALRGQGKFVDLNSTSSFGIDDLLVSGPTGETYQIKPGSFIVYNLNSALCFDGSLGTDSDGDGLCDKDEIALGYNPQNKFSFGDGYGDLIHYSAKIAHDTLTPCQDRSDEDMDLLTKCEESYMKNNNPTGTSNQSTDPLNPDTDGDGIIDGIEFLMLHTKSAALDRFNLFQNFDTELINSGDQIRQHRNPLFPDSKIPSNEIYDTKIDFTGFSPQGQSCYKFSQSHLKLYPTLQQGNNTILIYYIESLQKDPNSPGVYVYSFQTLNNSSSTGLTINDKIFKLYKVPVTP